MPSEKHLRYWLDLGPVSLPLRELRGEEHVFAPFRFEAEVGIEGEPLEPDELLGAEATLRLERESTVRTIHGLVTDVWVSAARQGVHQLMVVLEPRLALMRFRQDIRLFRDKNAVDIVLEVLAGHGISPELRLAGSYAMRPYCVQLRETDLDFMHRLLEDEGIFYFFREDGTLVLGDTKSSYDVIAGNPVLPFRAGLGMDREEDCVVEIGSAAQYLAGKITLRDFNVEHPRLDMDVVAQGPTPGGPEYYDYPGEYALPAEGKVKVQKMAEALACASLVQEGRSFSGRLLPGATFMLAFAPPGVEDGSYVVTRVLHDFHVGKGGFSVAFEALPGEVAFRPPRVTPTPVLTDPITGIVTGPPGEDIHCDEYGRVKVHFHWDRLFPYDDTCSHWVPVLQDNTGHSMSIPRIGWEVLVHFLEGDPDRPVVVGRVFNPEDPPHLFLPINKTRSVIKTLTSPREPKRDDSGTNEIYFEDLQGLEFIQYLAQKDQNVVIANDKTETVWLNQSSTVERDESVAIGANHTVTVGKDYTTTVKQDLSYTVQGNRTVSVDEADQGAVKGNHVLSVGGNHVRRMGVNDTALATRRNLETVGGVVLETSQKENTQVGRDQTTLVVGGSHVELAKEDKNEGVGRTRIEVVNGSVVVNAGAEIGMRANNKRSTSIGGSLSVTSTKETALTGVSRFVTLSDTAALEAPQGILLKVQDTQVVIKPFAIKVDGKSEIKLTVTGKNEQGTSTAAQN